jgi:hypothetical protein
MILSDEKIEEVLLEIDEICLDIVSDAESDLLSADVIKDPTFSPPTGVITC